MGNIWKCKTCGKINQEYIGTCGCGGLKEDGILINEENLANDSESEKKRKWQCPDCLKINELGICTCGHVKISSDKFLDEKPDLELNTKSETKKNIAKAAIIIAVTLVIFLILGGKKLFSGISSSKKNAPEDSYLNSIVSAPESLTGVAFNMSFSDVKPIIGRILSVDDFHSSSRGWHETLTYKNISKYSITNSGGVQEVNVFFDSNDNDRVISVCCTTKNTNAGYMSNAEIISFSEVFAEISGVTTDSVKSILTDLYYDSIDADDTVSNYQKGVILVV